MQASRSRWGAKRLEVYRKVCASGVIKSNLMETRAVRDTVNNQTGFHKKACMRRQRRDCAERGRKARDHRGVAERNLCGGDGAAPARPSRAPSSNQGSAMHL